MVRHHRVPQPGSAPRSSGLASRVLRDPYLRAAWRETARQWRAATPVELAQRVGLPVLAVAALVPLVRRTFLAFLDLPPDLWERGVVEVVFRADLLALSVVVLGLYEQVVRGRDREVLQSLPVDPAAVMRLAAVRSWLGLHRWVAGGAVLLAPIAVSGRPDLWAAAVASAWVCAASSVPLGIAGHLFAIHAAESPAVAPLLELVRGNNPRAQAAFLYAPGVMLLVGGVLLRASAEAVPLLAAGSAAGAFVAAPLLAGGISALAIPWLARSAWFRGSVVISEIDARYAVIEDPGEARRVYLEWAVRFLPAPARVYALADLRHGWRARRTGLSAQWLGAAVAFAAGWTAAADGPLRAVAVAVASVAVVGGVGVAMDADEPALLRVVLPRHPGWSRVARAAALLGWSAPAPSAAVAAVWLRDGDAGLAAAVCTAAVGVAVAASLACGRLRERGLRVYVPAVSVAGAALLLGLS
jgi:hypothetical protein